MAETDVDRASPPSGWYPDPEAAGFLRRWDGHTWTDDRIPATRARRAVRAREGREPEPAPLDDGGIADAVARGQSDLAQLEQATARELERRAAELAHLEEETRTELERRRALLEDVQRQEVQSREGARVLAVAEDEARGRLESARREIAALTAAREATTGEVEEHRTTLTALTTEVAEVRGRLEAARAGLDELTVAGAKVAGEIEERSVTLAELTAAGEAAARVLEDRRATLAELATAEEDVRRRLRDQEAELTRLTESAAAVAAETERQRRELAALQDAVDGMRAEQVDLGERLAVQDLGLYEYRHPAEDSVVLSTRLGQIRQAVVQVLREGDAVTASPPGKLGRSAGKGGHLADEMAQLALRSYNAEAESCVRTAGAGGIDGALTRLIRAREAVARHGEGLGIAITDRYHQLRTDEIEIASDYRVRQQREEMVARNRSRVEPAPPAAAPNAAGWAGPVDDGQAAAPVVQEPREDGAAEAWSPSGRPSYPTSSYEPTGQPSAPGSHG